MSQDEPRSSFWYPQETTLCGVPRSDCCQNKAGKAQWQHNAPQQRQFFLQGPTPNSDFECMNRATHHDRRNLLREGLRSAYVWEDGIVKHKPPFIDPTCRCIHFGWNLFWNSLVHHEPLCCICSCHCQMMQCSCHRASWSSSQNIVTRSQETSTETKSLP